MGWRWRWKCSWSKGSQGLLAYQKVKMVKYEGKLRASGKMAAGYAKIKKVRSQMKSNKDIRIA